MRPKFSCDGQEIHIRHKHAHTKACLFLVMVFRVQKPNARLFEPASFGFVGVGLREANSVDIQNIAQLFCGTSNTYRDERAFVKVRYLHTQQVLPRERNRAFGITRLAGRAHHVETADCELSEPPPSLEMMRYLLRSNLKKPMRIMTVRLRPLAAFRLAHARSKAAAFSWQAYSWASNRKTSSSPSVVECPDC